MAVFGQVLFGIATVMHGSALEIAILHRAGALAVAAVPMRSRFEIAYPAEQRIARG